MTPHSRTGNLRWYQSEDIEWIESLASMLSLKTALRNTWFETALGPSPKPAIILAKGLRELQLDHESGARKIAAFALTVLHNVSETLDDPISLQGAWWHKLRLAAWHLWKNGRPSMNAAIINFMLMFLTETATSLSTKGTDQTSSRLCVRNAFQSVQQQIRSFTTRISKHLASYVRSTFAKIDRPTSSFVILTLSASSTIRECIVQASLSSGAKNIDIRVLESRPLFEGVSMASSLMDCFQSRLHTCNVRIAIYTDASVALAAKDVDILLLGADCIAVDGSVSNKTGSLPAALSLRHMSPSGKIIVVSEIHKVAPDTCTETHVVEDNGPWEVTSAWEQTDVSKLKFNRDLAISSQLNIDVPNVYFEWVPPSLIDAYVCEDGPKDVSTFQQQSKVVKEQCEEYFEIF